MTIMMTMLMKTMAITMVINSKNVPNEELVTKQDKRVQGQVIKFLVHLYPVSNLHLGLGQIRLSSV